MVTTAVKVHYLSKILLGNVRYERLLWTPESIWDTLIWTSTGPIKRVETTFTLREYFLPDLITDRVCCSKTFDSQRQEEQHVHCIPKTIEAQFIHRYARTGRKSFHRRIEKSLRCPV
jgi:hypothetical protein